VYTVAKPLLHNPCMEGTYSDILDKIESELKSTDSSNVIWIRGSLLQIGYSLVVILGLNSVSGVQYKGMMIDR